MSLAEPAPSRPVNIREMPAGRVLTVCVCTHDRYDLLADVVAAMSQQTLDTHRVETLIVDNSSRKDGKTAFLARLPSSDSFRYVEFNPLGLSRARNQALKLTRTPYIAFLDDDAIPEPGWAESVIGTFLSHENVGFVGGPLTPIWPGPQPDWISPKMMMSLGILDLGKEERELEPYEFVYGANMAFDTEALRKTGGFDANLGRIGAKSLLSGEEISVQEAIRKNGMSGWYAPSSKVAHRISAHRIRRNWFRSRSAWQAVSDLLADPPQMKLKTAVLDLQHAVRSGSFPATIGGLVTNLGREATRDQFVAIRALVSILLGCVDADDTALEEAIGSGQLSSGLAMEREFAARAKNGKQGPYLPSAAVGPAARHVFVDSLPGHGFLYNIFDQTPDVVLLPVPHNLWRVPDPDDDLAFVERSITATVESIVFLTLDYFLRPRHMESFINFTRRVGRPVFGLLHRVPERPDQLERLQKIAASLEKIVVFSDRLREQLGAVGIANVVAMPLYPTKGQLVGEMPDQRPKFGIRPRQTVFSIVGDMREGKGIDLLLDALAVVPEKDRQRMFFLFAGRGRDYSRESVESRLGSVGVSARVDIRRGRDEFDYAVLSDGEYAENIAVSDFGVLLYRGEQRNCASAVLPDYIWLGKRVLTTADSVVGREVTEHDLGIALADETPEGVARALVEAVRTVDEARPLSPRYRAYRGTIAPSALADEFRRVLARDQNTVEG